MKNLIHRALAVLIVIVFVSSSIAILPVHAENIPTTATLNVGPSPGGVDQPLTVSMTVSPNPPAGSRFLNSYFAGIRDPDGLWTVMGPYSSQVGSGYAYFTFVPTKLGTYLFNFNYTGNTIGADTYSGSAASTQLVTVNPTQLTSASLSVVPNPSTVNYPLTISGLISPAPPSPYVYSYIYVNVTKPDGFLSTIGPFMSDATGQMIPTTYTPTSVGTYHFRMFKLYATFNGVFYAECYSSTVDVTVVDSFSLTITNANPAGSSYLTPFEGTVSGYAYGDVVSITAHPDVGWTFIGWSGDLSGTNNPETITMSGNKQVYANFVTINALSVSPNPIDLGQGVTISGQVVPPGIYALAIQQTSPYVSSPVATPTTNVGGVFSATYTPTSGSGSYSVAIMYNSLSIGGASFAVNPALSVSISPSSVSMHGGTSQLFTATVSGGTPLYSYQWYLDSYPVSDATSATWTYTPSSGIHNVNVVATDGVSAIATSNTASVTVYGDMSAAILPAGPVTMDVGQSQIFFAGVSNGIGTCTYQWYVDSIPRGTTAYLYFFNPATTADVGSHSIDLRVTDATGALAWASPVSVTVNPALATPSISADVSTLDRNQASTLTSSGVSGGSGMPYLYQWFGKAPGASVFSQISNAIYSSYVFVTDGSTALGTWQFELRVTDGVGGIVFSNQVSVLVNSIPSASILPSSVTLNFGDSQLFTASASGGTPPYTYQWYENANPVGGATADFTYTYVASSAGTHGVYVLVTDSTGQGVFSNSADILVNAATVTITIDSNPSISGYVKIDGSGWLSYPQTRNWVVGSMHTIEAGSPEEHGSGIWYAWTSWSDIGAISHGITIPDFPTTITANYKLQYEVTFTQSGSAVPTQVTYSINGGPNQVQVLPFSVLVDSDKQITYSYQATVPRSTGTQYALTSTIPTSPQAVLAPITITGNYVTQYQMPAYYSTSDGTTPTSSVILHGVSLGSATDFTLTTTTQNLWMDEETFWYANSLITHGTEQWFGGANGYVTSVRRKRAYI